MVSFNGITQPLEEGNTSYDITRSELEKKIVASETRRARWQLAYGDGFMPYEDFSKRMKEEMDHLQDLENQLNSIPNKPEETSVTAEEAVAALQKIKSNWEYLEQSTRKQIIQSLFKKIVIRKEGSNWTIQQIDLV